MVPLFPSPPNTGLPLRERCAWRAVFKTTHRASTQRRAGRMRAGRWLCPRIPSILLFRAEVPAGCCGMVLLHCQRTCYANKHTMSHSKARAEPAKLASRRACAAQAQRIHADHLQILARTQLLARHVPVGVCTSASCLKLLAAARLNIVCHSSGSIGASQVTSACRPRASPCAMPPSRTERHLPSEICDARQPEPAGCVTEPLPASLSQDVH